MEILEAIRSIRAFDLLFALILAAFCIAGALQGTIRRLLGLGSMVLALLLAAQLRDPLGGFFATNWTHLPQDYSIMIAFGTVFVLAGLSATIVTQVFYERVELFADYPIADEILGGLVGLLQGIFFVGAMFLILDPFFRLSGIPISRNELPILRELHGAMDASATAGLYRAVLIPAFLALAGAFIPSDVQSFFRR